MKQSLYTVPFSKTKKIVNTEKLLENEPGFEEIDEKDVGKLES